MVRPLSARLAQALRPRRVPQSHPRLHQQQRFASSTPGSEELQKKAQDALSSVQKGLGQAFEAGKKFLGPVGEKAGTLLGGTWCLRLVGSTRYLCAGFQGTALQEAYAELLWKRHTICFTRTDCIYL